MISLILQQQVFRCIGGGLLAASLLLYLSVTTLGHAKLVRSQPKAKETLSQAPKIVELWFSEELEPRINTIEVKDVTGKRVDRGEVMLGEGNKKAQVELEELTPGVYKVAWKALSADQHAMRGGFVFTVAAQSEVPTTVASNSIQTPSPSTSMAHAPEATTSINEVSDSGDRISPGESIVRWLSYFAMTILFGGFAFRSLVLMPALRSAVNGAQRDKIIAASTRRIVGALWLGIVLLTVTSLLALVFQAAEVFDKSFVGALAAGVLLQTLKTGFGPSWILQVGSLITIALILFAITRGINRNPEAGRSVLWGAGLAMGVALLAAPSWTGHAMLSVKHFRLAVLTDWLHLLAGGFWVGGLFHLVLTWPIVARTVPKASRPATMHYLIRFFTRTVMPSVVLLALAGLYNTWAHVPRLSALWVTPYGQALSVKLLLVLVMLLLGAINNYHFGKRAARLTRERGGTDVPSVNQLERGFYRSVVFEASLGVIVLLVTAVLVFLTPARNHPAMESGTAVGQQR